VLYFTHSAVLPFVCLRPLAADFLLANALLCETLVQSKYHVEEDERNVRHFFSEVRQLLPSFPNSALFDFAQRSRLI